MRARQSTQSLAVLFAAFALFGSADTSAQYKYIGPDGRVVYSDQPPPPAAKGVQKPATVGNVVAPAANSGGLPYALQQATKNFPVTLYTTADCDACNQGRTLLNKRGIPFSEKTVRNADDLKVFKEATGVAQVPVMMVGSGKQVGFEESAWNGALNIAGYPPNNILPASYKNPAAVPTAPFTPESKTAGAPPAAPTPGGQPATAPPAGDAPPAGSSVPSADGGGKPPNWFKGF